MPPSAIGRNGNDSSRRQLLFHSGSNWLLVFLVLATLLVVGDRYANFVWELGPPIPVVDVHVGSVLFSLALLGLTVGFLRRENVSLTHIGLAPRLLLPAIVAIAGYFLLLNAVGIALAVVADVPETIGYQWTVAPVEAAFVFVFMFVVAGIVEETVFRGYLQNKFIALLPGSARIRIAVGIIVASVLFSAYHVPRVMVDGPPGAMNTSGYLLLLFVNGIGFGLLYEFTHNLYVPITVHAAGNMPGNAGILFFHLGGWPLWAVTLYVGSYLGLIVVVILVYRRWASTTGLLPVWTERDASTFDRTQASEF